MFRSRPQGDTLPDHRSAAHEARARPPRTASRGAMIRRRPHKGRLTLLILLAVGGCGGDDATGPGENPTANPDFMVGDWLATSLLLTSKANPEVAVDLSNLGARFTRSVQPSGRYLAILEGYGQASSESGVLTVDGQTVIFKRTLPSPEESRAQWQRGGTSVTLEGDSEFDFNSDLTPEEATLRTVLVPL